MHIRVFRKTQKSPHTAQRQTQPQPRKSSFPGQSSRTDQFRPIAHSSKTQPPTQTQQSAPTQQTSQTKRLTQTQHPRQGRRSTQVYLPTSDEDETVCCGLKPKRRRTKQTVSEVFYEQQRAGNISGEDSAVSREVLIKMLQRRAEGSLASSIGMSVMAESLPKKSYSLSDVKSLGRMTTSEDAYFASNIRMKTSDQFIWRAWEPESFKLLRELEREDKTESAWICLAMHLKSGFVGVLKSPPRVRMNDARREFSVLTTCRASPFIIRIMDAFNDATVKRCFIFLEFAPFKTLDDLTRALKGVKESKAKLYIIEMVCALDYLHDRKIIHRDIKPENVFILLSGHVVLGDMGSCFFTSSSPDGYTKSRCGAYVTRPPEVWESLPYTYPVDIWELGVSVYNIISNTWPIMHAHRHLQIQAVSKGKIKFGRAFSELGANLIKRMLQSKPENRWTTKMIMTHPFFSDLKAPYLPPYNAQELMDILKLKDDIFVKTLVDQQEGYSHSV